LIEEVCNKLKELGLEALWQLRPSTFPSLTFSFIAENGQDFADDEEITTTVTLQVDVWSKGDYTEIVKQVKSKLEEINFYRIAEYDDFEEDTQIYHKILRFNKLIERVD
jgi:hypothetical protein